jgi:hypothetical protein
MSKRTIELPTSSPPALWRRRGAVLAAGAVVLLALVVAFAGPSAGIAVGRISTESAFLLPWLAAAAGYGGVFVERRLTGIAVGLGILSLIQLGIGLASQLHRWSAFLLIAIGVALLAYRCRRIRWGDVTAWLDAPADWAWLWLVPLPPLAIALVAALVPPGVLWGDEPHGYDVLEYHLQLPREFYEIHRVAPLKHNVFSYFPQGMEMHDLLAMQLRHGAWAGMYLAQLMHVAVVALAVIAVYAAARQFAQKLPAILAAIAAAYVPWTWLLAPVAYNEGLVLLFATLAIGWILQSDRRSWIIAGVMAGFACGAKLTAVPQVLLLLPIIAGSIRLARGERVGLVLRDAAAFVVTGVVVFSPWLIRNGVWARNPVFPEAQAVFGRAHFSETQMKRWQQAHSPTPAQRPIRARLRAAWEQIGADWRFGYVLLPLAVACAVVAIPRTEAKLLLILMLAWLVFWIGFTHLQGRFYVLAIPAAAMCLALLHTGRHIIFAAFGVLIVVVLGSIILLNTFADRAGMWRDRQLLGFEDFKQLLTEDVADLVAQQRTIALVGDAKAFLYQVNTEKIHYRTVFDVDVKPGQTIFEAWLGEQSGSPWIVVDPVELERFSRTYYGIPPLPDDFPGPRDRTFIPPRPAAPSAR